MRNKTIRIRQRGSAAAYGFPHQSDGAVSDFFYLAPDKAASEIIQSARPRADASRIKRSIRALSNDVRHAGMLGQHLQVGAGKRRRGWMVVMPNDRLLGIAQYRV